MLANTFHAVAGAAGVAGGGAAAVAAAAAAAAAVGAYFLNSLGLTVQLVNELRKSRERNQLTRDKTFLNSTPLCRVAHLQKIALLELTPD